MKNRIHPSASIHPTAVLGEGVDIGPFVVIGPEVKIGDRARLMPHSHIVTRTVLGNDCHICTGAVVGGDPQDLKFRGEPTDLYIGDRTRIGEFATVNRGTGVGGSKTKVGSDCMIMAYVHIAHDCIIGNNVVITNSSQLAGHIHIEDQAWVSGSVLVHHFVTIGSMSFVAPCSGVAVDIPPYVIVEGFRDSCKVRTLNMEGLKRRQVPHESIGNLKRAFKILYREKNTRDEAIAILNDSPIGTDPYVKNLLDHIVAARNGVQNRALERYRADKSRTISSSGSTVIVAKDELADDE
ncbi:MAG: acyl-ACP--UDP-N-acetylglucosamine O-acyltransferase [Planctomycetes bacterium]|nr:acyl-ACP--UDP-N-acetylglucosamine O-acyltransferase [Planctomycetota bacterium]MCD7895575.1 acyl-ACP--UDP-N-acetylglucosamine O-acyltransferase [Planctomycetaceae bacterium]